MMKNFYLLAVAAVLGVGASAFGSASDKTVPALQEPAVKKVEIVVKGDLGTVPLLVTLPSDFDNDHVEWCLKRYRSYNPRDNTWVSYSGKVRDCDSPFW